MRGLPASGAAAQRRSVLVVDDELSVALALRHVLGAAGYDVSILTDGAEAVDAVIQQEFDVIVSDINMPGLSGLALLRAIRSHDDHVPVVLMTGDPSLTTAMEAISLGAMHYLAKPMDNADLVRIVDRASTLHRLAKARRDAAVLLDEAEGKASVEAALSAGLDGALATLWMAFQPIVDSAARIVFGYEALMRSTEPSLPHPGAVLSAAERLHRLPDVGRRVRTLSAAAFAEAPRDALLFVNLHTCDLKDPDLYEPDAPLTRIAGRVVLEVTERASLDEVPDILARIAELRLLGFRIAIDDLGAGYAGLSSFVALEPEFVKLDMSLVRDVHKSPIRQRVIRSLSSLCTDLGMRVLAEGIENADEHAAMRELRCDLLQGYFFARPGEPFPTVRWGP